MRLQIYFTLFRQGCQHFSKLDIFAFIRYNRTNFIGQFVTILSVNKTKENRWALCAHFYLIMQKTKNLTRGALLAAAYVVLTYLQNFIFPNSTSFVIQFRASEALCVLALFFPAAIPGLSVGCFLYNLSYTVALPLDPIVGTLATFLATTGMYFLRNIKLKGLPLLSLLMPALFNAILIGWELNLYIGGGFWINALYVAIGEAAVLLTLGTALYFALKPHAARFTV